VPDIAVRATSYGMPSAIVDGQDADAVARAMGEAVSRARAGDGPTLVEMKTYRYSGHSRSDPATYRLAGELDAWLKRDPIQIFADRLESEGVIAAGELETLRAGTKDEIEVATAEVLASPGPEISEMLEHVTAAGTKDDRRWNFWSR
jgi:pyruvate dehydrogenase E1 component alpha subunit